MFTKFTMTHPYDHGWMWLVASWHGLFFGFTSFTWVWMCSRQRLFEDVRWSEVWCHHHRDLDWLAGAKMCLPLYLPLYCHSHPWSTSPILTFTSPREHSQLLVMSDFVEESKSRWRRVLKTLNLLEFLIKNGSERIIDEVRREQFKVSWRAVSWPWNESLKPPWKNVTSNLGISRSWAQFLKCKIFMPGWRHGNLGCSSCALMEFAG